MRTRFSLPMLSSARVLSSVILAGKRYFRRHSTSSFSEYVVVAKLRPGSDAAPLICRT